MSSSKWFVKKRGSYLPSSWQGWTSYVPFIAYLVISAIVIHRHTNSLSLLVISLAPQWVAAAVVLTWVAQQKS